MSTSLDGARWFLENPDETTVGSWPRAAALLARQALEQALDDFWATRAPVMSTCDSRRAQLLCLSNYVDEDLAEQVTRAWNVLSRAVHHRRYDLGMTGPELGLWMDLVDRLDATAILARV